MGAIESVQTRLGRIAAALNAEFLGKAEVIRLLLISIVAREHALLIGPPGTAKSALLRSLAALLDARYFEYLLTRFTEPSELFGPVDIAAFREGAYRRHTNGMLPQAEIVFLDEVFKSNSAILNALLTLLNERRFMAGAEVMASPLVSAFGASNEVPSDESLAALYDRFLLRIRATYLEPHHFNELVERGIRQEIARLSRERPAAVVSGRELHEMAQQLAGHLRFSADFLATYKSLVFQVRAEGITISDRRVVKLLKLLAASAYIDGRAEPDAGDLFVLKHVWNTEDQAPILESLVQPILDAFYREHPGRERIGALAVDVVSLAAEIDRIRQILTGPVPPSDLQLFTQLKALGEVRTTLGRLDDPRARALEQRVAQLLDASLKSERFSTI